MNRRNSAPVVTIFSDATDHSSQATQLFLKNIATVASRWQHCAQFDRLDLNPRLPLQRAKTNALPLDHLRGLRTRGDMTERVNELLKAILAR